MQGLLGLNEVFKLHFWYSLFHIYIYLQNVKISVLNFPCNRHNFEWDFFSHHFTYYEYQSKPYQCLHTRETVCLAMAFEETYQKFQVAERMGEGEGKKVKSVS